MAQVIHGSLRKWLYITSLTGSLIFALILFLQGRSLTTPELSGACSLPCDCLPPIVAFEFAGSADCAVEFVSSWKPALLETAKTQIQLQIPFAFFYPLLAALVCGSTAGLWTGWKKRIGGWISWAVILVCPVHFAENVALLQTLNETSGNIHAPFAAACATTKYGLLGLVLGYVVIALVPFVIGRLK